REILGQTDEPLHGPLRDLDDVRGDDFLVRADLARAPASPGGRRVERLEGEPAPANTLEDELAGGVGGGEGVAAGRRERDLGIRYRRRAVGLQEPSPYRTGLVGQDDEHVRVRVGLGQR